MKSSQTASGGRLEVAGGYNENWTRLLGHTVRLTEVFLCYYSNYAKKLVRRNLAPAVLELGCGSGIFGSKSGFKVGSDPDPGPTILSTVCPDSSDPT